MPSHWHQKMELVQIQHFQILSPKPPRLRTLQLGRTGTTCPFAHPGRFAWPLPSSSLGVESRGEASACFYIFWAKLSWNLTHENDECMNMRFSRGNAYSQLRYMFCCDSASHPGKLQDFLRADGWPLLEWRTCSILCSWWSRNFLRPCVPWLWHLWRVLNVGTGWEWRMGWLFVI